MTEVIIKSNRTKPPYDPKVGDWFTKTSYTGAGLYILTKLFEEGGQGYRYSLVNVSYGNPYTYPSDTKEGAFADMIAEFTKVDKVTLEIQ
jgi:hypothetical protein